MDFLRDHSPMAWEKSFMASELALVAAKSFGVKSHGLCMTRGKLLFSRTKRIIKVMFFIHMGS